MSWIYKCVHQAWNVNICLLLIFLLRNGGGGSSRSHCSFIKIMAKGANEDVPPFEEKTGNNMTISKNFI